MADAIANERKQSALCKAQRREKTYCEFFAGIGLVRAGLEQSGWRCIYANDNDAKKHAMYAARFGDGHFHLQDVCKTASVVERIDGPPFLATASFPCIDLSLAGHWRGLAGKHSSTFFAFADAIHALDGRKPKLVMIENVTGLITSHKGSDLKSLVHTLADLGYWLDVFVLDARHFVPQSRPRVFIVGLHKSVTSPRVRRSSQRSVLDPWLSIIDRCRHTRPKRLVDLMRSICLPTGWAATEIRLPNKPRALNLAEIIDTDDEQEWWDDAEVKRHCEIMSDLHKSKVSELIADGGLHIGTIYRRKRYGKTRAEVRFDGIAGCLRTPRGGSAKQIVIVVNDGAPRIRWMSPREYARLQGVGDFPLVGTRIQQLFGFGDAVCVPVIQWIDKIVLTPIFESIRAEARR